MNLYLQITTFLLAAVAAAGGLVAIWGGDEPGALVLAMLGVWAFVAAMLPVRAYEPAVVFGIGMPIVAGVLCGACWCWLGEKGRPVQFELRDAFWVLLIVGMSLALLRQITQSQSQLNAYEGIVPIVSFVVLTIASYWFVAGRRRILAGCTLVVLIPLATWLWWPKVTWLDDVHTLGLHWDRAFPNNSSALRVIGTGVTEFVAILSGLAALIVFSRTGHRFVNLARTIFVGIGVLWSFIVVWMYVEMWPLSPFPLAFGLVSECSEEVVRTAELVYRLEPRKPNFNPRSASMMPAAEANELRRLYERVLPCLDPTNSMPFDARTDISPEFFRMAHDRILWLRELCICLDAECKEAEKKGDRQLALKMAMANLRLGTMCCRNGTSIEAQVGGTYLDMPLRYFVQVRTSLTPEEIDQVKAAICRVEAELEPVELIQKRDIAYSQREYGWQGRLSAFVARGEGEKETARAVVLSRNRWHAVSRLLMTDLAIRSYQRDLGSWPQSLGELVPGYLDELPIDPYSGKRLKYLLDGDDFALYSVGQDRQDNAGHSSERHHSLDGEDLRLDSLVRD